MSLPPALLARLAQRGLVQKQQKAKKQEAKATQQVENEEVIAEDYDEMDSEEDHGPENYPETITRKPAEENFWIERIKARMGESSTASGHKGCPNKYNIWHKCSLFCVNRWEDGHTEPSRDYMRRYKRLLRKYPLPKGWTEMYDPGCGCFYFYSASENLVSWLPPTHPNSQVSKSAAVLRRQLEDETVAGGVNDDSDDEQDENVAAESASARHQREVDEIISSSMSGRDYRPSEDTENSAPRKQKSRDLERIISRQRERERDRDRGRDRDYERERERNRERSGYVSSSSRRNYGREDADVLDPMDPSAYSDTPRGKWSSGLNTANEDQAQKSAGGERSGGGGAGGRDRRNRDRDRRKADSDDDEDDYH